MARKVFGKFVVASGDAAEVLQPGEERLHEIALTIEPRAEVGFQRRLDLGGIMAVAPLSRKDARMRSASQALSATTLYPVQYGPAASRRPAYRALGQQSG